ncbi:MAG: NAD(P)/FAD-dependent oxidoreductase [Burkholderiaceae bacterium]
MPAKKLIVIVGGGFGGSTVMRTLDKNLPADVELVLISEESYTTFNPMLPEAVGASIFPEHVVAPLRALFKPGPQRQFIMAKVTDIDPHTSTLSCSSLGGVRKLRYDHLILAFGNRARLDLIPGMEQHAMPLKTVGDALEIRNAVLRRLARIELETDTKLRQQLGHFVVIGGGFSGVEVAGELVDCLHSVRQYYPMVAKGDLKVTVLHDTQQLLPELNMGLGRAALASLQKRKVSVQLGARAAEVTADGVKLTSGEFLEAATVISTIGTRPNALAEHLGFATERGRIPVLPDMRVKEHANIWALGDCALVPNAHDGKFAPPTAQFAVRQAKQLAANLMAVLMQKDTRAFNHKSAGAMASIGHMKGVADVFGFSVSGLPAWLLWRAYYLSQMPTFGRKVRIYVEWTWGMFFPTDITHLRFLGSRDVANAETALGSEQKLP